MGKLITFFTSIILLTVLGIIYPSFRDGLCNATLWIKNFAPIIYFGIFYYILNFKISKERSKEINSSIKIVDYAASKLKDMEKQVNEELVEKGHITLREYLEIEKNCNRLKAQVKEYIIEIDSKNLR